MIYQGTTCPLARWGYPRDGRRGKPQLLVGLVTSGEGCPVAVEVFPGNTAEPMTLAPQVSRLRQRFGLQWVVVDRGMITQARIREELAPAQRLGLADRQLDWMDWVNQWPETLPPYYITALRAPKSVSWSRLGPSITG